MRKIAANVEKGNFKPAKRDKYLIKHYNTDLPWINF